MSEAEQPAARDPFYDLVPEKMWIGLTNIGVKEGMVELILEVNGQQKTLYHSYVIDGTVSHWWNLTGWIKRDATTLAARVSDESNGKG